MDGALQPLSRKDTIVVCGGADIASTSTLDILNWLRRETRKGVSCGAIGTATHTLAMAGLLSDKSVTTHWEYHSAFAETFPDLSLNNSIFSIEQNRFTCAGGASSMDLMLYLIANDYDQTLANWVADQLVYTSPRTKEHKQRLSTHCHNGVRNEKFSQAITLMSNNTEEPLAHSALAKDVGISTRQLERLFRKYLNTSPKVYYMELRLEKARNLLLQTNMSITEICVACGFNSTSHFSKCYRHQFGLSPSFENAASSSKAIIST